MKKFNETQWMVFSAAGILAAFIFASFITPIFSYSRWDNFEYFVPTLMEAHGQWLKGCVPLWNWHQHMGEPLLANAQPGVFYFPYTVAVAIVQWLKLNPVHLTLLLVGIHLVWGAMGLFRLLRQMGVRPEAAWVSAISVGAGSFIGVFSTIWIFMPLVFSWLPWVCLGVVRLWTSQRFSWEILWLPLGLAQIAFVGYPQLLFYSFIFVFFLAALTAFFFGSTSRVWLQFGALVVVAVFVTAPFWAPTLEQVGRTSRSSEIELRFFLERSVHPRSFLSILSPFFALDNGYLGNKGDFSFFQGLWLPAVLLGAWIKHRQKHISNFAFIFLGLALIFTLFALGQYGGVYALTHGVPGWSHFRWPFKFLLFANLSIGVLGGLGLESWLSCGTTSRQRIVAGLIVAAVISAVLLGLWVRPAGNVLSIPGILVLFAGSISLGLIPFLEQIQLRRLFLVTVFFTSVGVVSLVHSAGMKTYGEPMGGGGPRELGIDPEFRVLPLTSSKKGDPVNPVMQALGLFQSATANQYFSLTGCTTAMAPSRFLKWIPSNTDGVLPPKIYEMLLSSHLLKSWNVRYVIVGKEDEWGLSLLEKCKFERIGSTEHSEIYEQASALPRAYFATVALPYSREAFMESMFYGAGPATAAFLHEPCSPLDLPAARVLSMRWEERKVRLEVDAPQGGLLVLAVAYDPGWEVFVDGRKEKLLNVNDMVQGVWVPAGAKIIKFHYRSRALEWGVAVALGGLLILGMVIRSILLERNK